MSYATAKECFEENIRGIDGKKDPVTWNLNSGLLNLTKAIENDLHRMQKTLNSILESLHQ
jgi:hypothetical protein